MGRPAVGTAVDHLQLYYGAPGRMADMLGQVLRERAKAGVRVFVLYDAFGAVDIPATHRDELRSSMASSREFIRCCRATRKLSRRGVRVRQPRDTLE